MARQVEDMAYSTFGIFIAVGTILCLIPSSWARLGMGSIALTNDTFYDFVRQNERVMVDFFDSSSAEWRNAANELEAAVRKARDMGSNVPVAKVDAVKDQGLAEKFVPHKKYPQLVWFLKGEATQYHRTLRKSKEISDFVLALDRDPLMVIDSKEEAYQYVPCVFAQLNANEEVRKTLEVVAQKYMDVLAFSLLEHKQGAGSDGNGIFWLSNGSTEEAIQFKGDMTPRALERWVRSSLAQSEPIPEDPELLEDEGSRVVFGKTFEDEVFLADKDVILLVHAPWCGHCKKFNPTWVKFAQEVKDVPHLKVAKIDGTRNTSPLPAFRWDAYPKIFFVKAGTEEPVVFEGNRTIDALVSFVETHGSKPLTGMASRTTTESALDL